MRILRRADLERLLRPLDVVEALAAASARLAYNRAMVEHAGMEIDLA
ncbi:MAG TPA: hypothetical protein VGM22_25250 [Methylomirabilota bacterium]|jgi:hypothetical protein